LSERHHCAHPQFNIDPCHRLPIHGSAIRTALEVEDLIEILSEDAGDGFGLYLEGIRGSERFERAAALARAAGKTTPYQNQDAPPAAGHSA